MLGYGTEREQNDECGTELCMWNINRLIQQLREQNNVLTECVIAKTMDTPRLEWCACVCVCVCVWVRTSFCVGTGFVKPEG